MVVNKKKGKIVVPEIYSILTVNRLLLGGKPAEKKKKLTDTGF